MIIKSFVFRKKYLFITIFILTIAIFATIYSIAVEKNYIKWIDFTPTSTILQKVSQYDITSHKNDAEIKYNWIELLSFLAAKYGGNFNLYKQSDLDTLISRINAGETIEDITNEMKYYKYYYEAYSTILGEFIGEYSIQKYNGENVTFAKQYGIKAFSPVAKGYHFSHSDDFGNSRSYGYKRIHLGNDLLGSIGTPIIAIESGYVEAVGWNQYGGWRIGIRSFDKKRYYYYAHLRRNHPYCGELVEGQIIKAGDVIGYLGMTGYSTKENVNNIKVPHLHLGMQIIFDESQKDGVNQIWIDMYHIVEFLRKNTSEVYYDEITKEYYRKYEFIEKSVTE